MNPRDRRVPAWTSRLLLIVTLGAAGCTVTPRIDVPSTLPNVTRQDFLTLRWALVREGSAARAVGVAESSGGPQWDATLELLGVDAAGNIVSRGATVARPGFGPGTTRFEVTLAETGRETEFRLQVSRAQQFNRPGR